MGSDESSYGALSRTYGQVCRSDPKAASLLVSGWENALGMFIEVQQTMAGC